MTLAVTLMIRDEADILPAWLAYHVAQGVDVFVITDNGSEDATPEILAEFAARTDVTVDLRHDPVHRKQQGTVVTQMARDAARLHHADWVVNADADEFLIPKDRSLTLGAVFGQLDRAVGAFVVPVVNLVGRMARSGAGIDRLHWRDGRSTEELQAIGLLAQPSPNVVHVGDPEVVVVQGNHQASVAAGDPVPPGLELEVLHLPWRSVQQYEHRAETTGRAYEANPTLTPSPNHHGMRDYRRLGEGTLRAYFALRSVTDTEARTGSFTRDDGIAAFLRSIGSPVLDAAPDVLVGAGEVATLAAIGRALVSRDRALADALAAASAAGEQADLWRGTSEHERARADHLQALLSAREAELAAMRARRVVRMADRVGQLARRGRGR